jgi:DNA-binding transcriptional MerR regulator
MDKSPDAFRTISEAAELLETPAHVLRFWESRFPQIKPVKRAGGRRYYRPADLALLTGIRRLLHDEGLTIRGVQKLLREQGVRYVSGLSEQQEADMEQLDSAEAPKSAEPILLFPAKPVFDAAQKTESQGDMPPAPEEERRDDITPPVDAVIADEALPEPEARDFAEFPHKSRTAEPLNDQGSGDRVVELDPLVTVTDALDPVPDLRDPEIESNQPDLFASPDALIPERPAIEVPNPLPQITDLTGHWLPADLRCLPRGAMLAQRDQLRDLLHRLESLRNRVGDLGRVPRR